VTGNGDIRVATARRAPALGPTAACSSSVAGELVAALARLGVTHAFGITGGANAPFCEELARSAIRFVHGRHESGAAFAACEASLATDRPTVVCTTTGPGLLNALNGLATARHEGARVILVSGATSSAVRGRGAVQETTCAASLDLFRPGPIFHHAVCLEHASELNAAIARLAGGLARPQGFVAHIALPVALQSARADRGAGIVSRATSPATASEASVQEVLRRLGEGSFVVWLGYGARHASAEIRAFVERTGAPVVASPRAKGIVSETHPSFVGVTGLGGYGDVEGLFARLRPRHVLVLGSRLGEGTSFWSPELVGTHGFVHVDVDDTAFGAAYPEVPTLGVVADIRAFVGALVERWSPDGGIGWRLEPPSRALLFEARPTGRVRGATLMRAVQRTVVDGTDALVLAESGNAALWSTHGLRFGAPHRYRVSPGMGSMTHASAGVTGVAIATGRRAVAIVGDGSMLMQNEVSTAVAHGAPAVWIVLNDARYGMVEDGLRGLGWEPFATRIPACDFAAYARSVGAEGVRVEREDELDAGLAQAMRTRGPVVVDVLMDAEAGAPRSARVASLRRQGVFGSGAETT